MASDIIECWNASA